MKSKDMDQLLTSVLNPLPTPALSDSLEILFIISDMFLHPQVQMVPHFSFLWK